MIPKVMIVCAAVVAFLGLAPQAVIRVPASLLEDAQKSPILFAVALAGASVPNGFEIPETDDFTPPVMSPSPGVQTVPATEVTEAFEKYHHEYRAVMMGRVLVVRPRVAPLPLLDTRSTIAGPVKVTGIMTAARRVFAFRWPMLLGPALNSLGRPGSDVEVVLHGQDRRVIDMLNQIVLQAPKRGWIIITGKAKDGQPQMLSFGFLDARGGRVTCVVPAS